MAKKVDISLLSQLNAGAENQEVQKGSSRSSDPRFPLFQTPVNEKVLVYIPTTNCVATENGTQMKLLTALLHTHKSGNFTAQMRCINGLSGGIYAEALGYDGTCPACNAVQDCWKLYNRKMELKAKELGLTVEGAAADPSDPLKEIRKTLLNEMDFKGAEEYVTFPVVTIPIITTPTGGMSLAPDAAEKMTASYCCWRRNRYDDSLIKALNGLMNNPGHPAGRFFIWDFTYDTKGKPANARDSAKSAKYALITDPDALNAFAPFKVRAEELAKEFTNDKATEVITCNNFMYADDIAAAVDRVMSRTRQLLDIVDVDSVSTATPALAAGNPLASFGGAPAPAAITGDLGVTTPAAAPVAPATAPAAPAFAPTAAPAAPAFTAPATQPAATAAFSVPDTANSGGFSFGQ